MDDCSYPSTKSRAASALAAVRLLKTGDIVLVHARGRDYLHLVKARDGERFLIGNNRGATNGWVSRHAIYGNAISIERP